MKIEELKDKQGRVNIDLKIIWNQGEPRTIKNINNVKGVPDERQVQEVLVGNIDSEKGDGTPTAYLDLYDDNIGKFKQFDKIRIVNAYSKLIQGKTQFRITNAESIELITE